MKENQQLLYSGNVTNQSSDVNVFRPTSGLLRVAKRHLVECYLGAMTTSSA
jgi:hypothetical protein